MVGTARKSCSGCGCALPDEPRRRYIASQDQPLRRTRLRGTPCVRVLNPSRATQDTKPSSRLGGRRLEKGGPTSRTTFAAWQTRPIPLYRRKPVNGWLLTPTSPSYRNRRCPSVCVRNSHLPWMMPLQQRWRWSPTCPNRHCLPLAPPSQQKNLLTWVWTQWTR